jgi:hypothetical protein
MTNLKSAITAKERAKTNWMKWDIANLATVQA